MDNNTPSTELTGPKTTIFKQEQFQSLCCWLCWCSWPSWCRCLGCCCWPSWCCWPSRSCKRQVTYRIPALIYISHNKTYLAFAEKRNTPDDTDADVLVMKTGKWKDDENKVEWDSSHKELTSASLPNHRCMNPCPVYDRKSKKLFLFFICVPIGVSEEHQKKTKKNQARLCYTFSLDTGTTWEPTIDLTADVIGEKEKNWATFAVGPGHGVQMESGRLIIPAYAYYFDSTNVELTSRAFTFYSEETQNTVVLHVGEYIEDDENKNQPNECQMAEILDDSGHSTLYCNAKSKSGHRVEALSSNNGQAFDKPSTAHKLIETGDGCQGSVLKINFLDKSKWLLYSHPTDAIERKNLGIYVNKSPLDLTQWNLKTTINNGPSGYSDLAECAKTEYIACLMECGDKKENEEIAFKFVSIKDAVDSPQVDSP